MWKLRKNLQKFQQGLEPGTFCMLIRCDNHYTTKPPCRKKAICLRNRSFCLISMVFYTCISKNWKPRGFLPIFAYGKLNCSQKRQLAAEICIPVFYTSYGLTLSYISIGNNADLQRTNFRHVYSSKTAGFCTKISQNL